MITYEQRLNRNLDWALREGSMHFDKENEVHKTLRKIVKRLSDLGIPYALVGGQATALWVATKDPAAVRTTKDVDILLRREDLPKARAAAAAEAGVGWQMR